MAGSRGVIASHTSHNHEQAPASIRLQGIWRWQVQAQWGGGKRMIIRAVVRIAPVSLDHKIQNSPRLQIINALKAIFVPVKPQLAQHCMVKVAKPQVHHPMAQLRISRQALHNQPLLAAPVLKRILLAQKNNNKLTFGILARQILIQAWASIGTLLVKIVENPILISITVHAKQVSQLMDLLVPQLAGEREAKFVSE
jgi:riboflavin synthase